MTVIREKGKNSRAVSAPACRPVIKNCPLIITTCSSTKRQTTTIAIDDLKAGQQAAVATQWLARLRDEEDLHLVKDLYGGRAFGLAKDAASQMEGDLAVISAGLGYVEADSKIPSYDLTIRPSAASSVRNRIRSDFDATTWWRSVSSSRFSSSLIQDIKQRPLTLICLSRAYAEMVGDELIQLGGVAEKIRIFGLSIEAHIPASLKKSVMPYDERLSSIGRDGTRVEFAQRALLHFVQNIAKDKGTLQSDRAEVLRLLSQAKITASKRVQNRIDDNAVRHLIRQLQVKHKTCGQMLHHIRNVENLSCEQSRFSKLFKEEMVGAK